MKSRLESMEVIWRGQAQLLLHNGDLADPLNPHAKKIKKLSAKRRKTDEDHLDLSHAEFVGSFYYSDEFGPCIPVDNVLSVICEGARKSKLGREATLAIFVEGLPPNGKRNATGDAGVIRLDYDGPRDLEELWNGGSGPFVSKKPVRVGQAKIMRTRALIPRGWSLHFRLRFDPAVLNQEQVEKAMEDAGDAIGLGDWRPRFGIFSVDIL